MLELIIAVMVGFLVATLLKLNKAKAKKDETGKIIFTWKIFIKENWIPSLVNIFIGAGAVLARDSLPASIPVDFLTCFLLGAAGQFILKGLADTVTPGISTYIGLNDE
jgi:hypothetical protein